MFYLYALKDGERICYVGQTQYPEQRLAQHHRMRGEHLNMSILEAVGTKEEADAEEQAWIWFYGQKHALLNVKHALLYVTPSPPLCVLIGLQDDELDKLDWPGPSEKIS